MVAPIFKKGNSCEPIIYRPLSLTSVFSKLFESIIKSKLLQYLHSHSLITVHQHGFLSNHSTLTNSIESLNDWTSSLDHKYCVKLLYTDFTKAFDVVSIPKLLYKLELYGIKGLLLSCINSFITGRVQCVRVGSATSGVLPVLNGVAQGSVLGPLLF